ncbi:MAG: metallophosphoesterase family protein [Nitrospira sp.]|nr:metallophosphoesterase family protein [Nitrospira sp.]
MKIGVIADTHGLFDQAILRHFQGVDHIIHAGDIGGRSVISALQAIAPVTAVSGNVDGYGRSGFKRATVIELAGKRIAIRHILYEGGKLTKEGLAFLERELPDVCIFGHTHRPTCERHGDTLLFNPGSAGPKRFTLPRGLGLLVIAGETVTPRLIRLADRPESIASGRQLGRTRKSAATLTGARVRPRPSSQLR